MDVDSTPGSIVLLRKRPISDFTSSVQQTHKHFLRKTARGRVVKVLREHYLRPDIPCGSLLCDACDEFYGASLRPTLAAEGEEDSSSKTERPLLSVSGRSLQAQGARGHYLVLDTNVVLHQVSFYVVQTLCCSNWIMLSVHLLFFLFACCLLKNAFNLTMGGHAANMLLFSSRWIFSRHKHSGAISSFSRQCSTKSATALSLSLTGCELLSPTKLVEFGCLATRQDGQSTPL
jgi:hypothetical protein